MQCGNAGQRDDSCPQWGRVAQVHHATQNRAYLKLTNCLFLQFSIGCFQTMVDSGN